MNHHVSIRHEIAVRNAIFFWEHADRPLESWVTISSTAETPAKFQSDTIIITSNLAVSILHEIWR